MFDHNFFLFVPHMKTCEKLECIAAGRSRSFIGELPIQIIAEESWKGLP